ncbi:MAG: carboxypeptidase regulatory-like domain-containing protein [Planctomycetaceae bacterium]|nr:carboxypeptidase regulatory-like domain-containing protein [Planctomycetaceae bacterium]
MSVLNTRVAVCLMIGALALSLGCAPEQSDRPKTYPVTGTVTYNGEPVADANLNFQLVGGSSFALAKTDASGKYALMTFEAGDGAIPGEYKVTISKFEAAAATGTENEEEYAPPEEGAEPPPSKSLLPDKYRNPETSGFTATVTEAGPNTFDFELTD